jgi:flavin reductase (DIM6/NTAB) family NADH-FMN oxidoreductase RutF
MQIDTATLTHDESYRLLSGAVVPRPIAWVNSGIEPGTINLAPFSTFTFVSPFPPMIGFNCGLRDNHRKDTSRNIHAYGEFVVHIADETMVEMLHCSSHSYAPDVSEIDLLGLAILPSTKIRTPRLKDAPIGMECRLSQVLNFGSTGSEFLVGEILVFHIHDRIYKDGRIDTSLLRPLCRLGGPTYASLGNIITMPSI